ncbi:Gfo/Idh/MocA family protein [Bailinhaonella thermotolerans]|uniref:Gfo/Idh/MocA family oxidoreductase n=1 Tax=Bailinhaonella thermotolerans TaxID=1070861 RepID=A0A3A4BB60_9ACTN|nr:Gfo/Idh/MocA family oxidoreductase [Bailinhaonella thermotolerans]RJL35316.1 gfo/Idh/MocA family oxidoreductase [Bailinhaonella thermotolerans]
MIRVGVVGASGWADGSHLPALAALEEFEVSAVATTSQASADRVAAAHGVRHAFADAAELAAHPEVDLVVVSVKASGHAAVIRAALEAGKHVVSEWPLGVDAGQARELTEAATAAGVAHAVVLQGHHAPSARFAADLLAAGRIGTLESVALVAEGAPWGGSRIRPDLVFGLDPAEGTNILTIMAGHFLAALERVAGPLVEVSARLPRAHERVLVAGTERTVPNATPSHVLLHGLLAGGATASVTVHGGDGPLRDGFLLKLVGSEATLTATPAQRGTFIHWGEWDIRIGDEVLAVPGTYHAVPAGVRSGPPANIAALYQEVARAIAEGRQPHPSFETALRHHRLLAAIERSAAEGIAHKVS